MMSQHQCITDLYLPQTCKSPAVVNAEGGLSEHLSEPHARGYCSMSLHHLHVPGFQVYRFQNELNMEEHHFSLCHSFASFLVQPMQRLLKNKKNAAFEY